MKTFTVTAEVRFDLEFEVDEENAEKAKSKLFDRLSSDLMLPEEGGGVGYYYVGILHRYPEKTMGGAVDPDRNPEFGYGEHWKTCPIGQSNGFRVTKAEEKK